LVIPYENINTITKSINNNKYQLIIGNDSEEKIILQFLSEFYLDQANSRIHWVLEFPGSRTLTKTTPPLDIEPPVINWTTFGSDTGYTYLPCPTGTTLSKTDIIDIYVDSISDSVDGQINKDDIYIEIFIENDIIPLESISQEGVYVLYFSIKDIANNLNKTTRYTIVDSSGPVINFKPISSGSTYDMSIQNDSSNGSEINKNDIRVFSVDSVQDNIQSGLTISDIVVNIELSGVSKNVIDIPNEIYNIEYILTDIVNNSTTYTKQINSKP
jgi:hypothetical protein